MTHKVSSTELYDNQSIIVKMKRIEDKVDGAQSSVEASVAQAQEASASAQSSAQLAQQAAGSIGNIAEQAQQAVNTANAASAAASAAVTQAEQKAQAVVDAATDGIKMDIIRELGTDIEDAKDKADLAYTTASGFGTAIASMQSAVNSTQQEMSGVRTTAQTASAQATQTQGNLDLHITQAANTYATKTELASKADSTEIAAVIDLVGGKLSKSQADAYYQPVGDYLTEAQGDAKYALKGQGGGDGTWGSITGEITDQEDLIQLVDSRTSGLVTSDTLNQETAWAKNTAVDEAKAYVDGKPFVNKEYVDNGLATNKTQCNNYTDTQLATTAGSLLQEISGKQPAGNYALKSEIPDVSEFVTVTAAARDYQPKGDYALKSDISAVYKFKGTVSTKSQLPSAEMVVGDVYNVASSGMNYAWDGSAWDALGTDIDLSDYLTKDEAQTTYATNQLLIGVINHADLLDTTKQDKLTPGEGITIEDNVISATGGSGGASVVSVTNSVGDRGTTNYSKLTTTVEFSDGTSISSEPFNLIAARGNLQNNPSSSITAAYDMNSINSYSIGNAFKGVVEKLTVTDVGGGFYKTSSVGVYRAAHSFVYGYVYRKHYQSGHPEEDLEFFVNRTYFIIIWNDSTSKPVLYTSNDNNDISMFKNVSEWVLTYHNTDTAFQHPLNIVVLDAFDGSYAKFKYVTSTKTLSTSEVASVIAPIVDPSKFPRASGSDGVEIPSELPHGDKTAIQDSADHYLYLFDRTGLIGGPTLSSSKDIVTRGIAIADKRIGVYAGNVDANNLITTVSLEKGNIYGTVVGTDGAGGNTYFILFKAVDGVWVKEAEGSIPYSDLGQSISYWYTSV